MIEAIVVVIILKNGSLSEVCLGIVNMVYKLLFLCFNLLMELFCLYPTIICFLNSCVIVQSGKETRIKLVLTMKYKKVL